MIINNKRCMRTNAISIAVVGSFLVAFIFVGVLKIPFAAAQVEATSSDAVATSSTDTTPATTSTTTDAATTDSTPGSTDASTMASDSVAPTEPAPEGLA